MAVGLCGIYDKVVFSDQPLCRLLSVMHKQETKKWWKRLFVILLVFFVFEIIGMPFEKSLGVSDAVWLIISGLSLIPIYGYAYQVAVGSKGIAITIFIANLPPIILGTYLAVLVYLNNQSVVQLLFSLLGFVVVGIIVYPMYRYAFYSNHLWSENA